MAGEPNYGEEGSTLARDLGEQYRELHKTEFVDLNPKIQQLAIVPFGRKIESLKPFLDQFREKPERRKGTVQALDIDSFIKLVTRFASGESMIFAKADATSPSLTAVFDYTPAGGDAKSTDWREHRALYAPQLSDEWKAWKAKDGQFMSVADFAAFLEERIMDVTAAEITDKQRTYAELVKGTYATPSQLIELSRGLEVNVGGTVKNAFRNASGEITVSFSETHAGADGQPLKVPNLFQLAIPVFKHDDAYRLSAWLRYRVSGSSITWAYQLVRPDLAFKDAFDALVDDLRVSLEVPIVQGVPE
jgi:uncharacterized protein YfdQ (DUF2303 family)